MSVEDFEKVYYGKTIRLKRRPRKIVKSSKLIFRKNILMLVFQSFNSMCITIRVVQLSQLLYTSRIQMF